MLQRLVSLDDELYGDGTWPSAQLQQMNDNFCRAVTRALSSGHENFASMTATVQIGSSLNGRRRLAKEEAAIESAWRYLRTNMDAGIDVSFVEVLAFARERCSGVTAEQVRVEFKKRFKGRWQSTATSVV